MIVDDEADILLILKKGLMQNGFEVVAFSSPVDALHYFKINSVNIYLVITEARMLEMTGFELARGIKDVDAKVRIIAISAFEINKSEFDKVMPRTRIDGFLTKPFHVTELLGAIKALD